MRRFGTSVISCTLLRYVAVGKEYAIKGTLTAELMRATHRVIGLV
jgi:hypothetical protein